MGLVTWFRQALAGDPPAARSPVSVRQGLPAVTLDKAIAHQRRFRLALEQCEEGDARRRGLKANLDHWTEMRALLERGGRE